MIQDGFKGSIMALAWRDYRRMGSTAVDGSKRSISPWTMLSSHESDLLESSGEPYRSNARRVVSRVQLRG